jgi:pSer/pThr/pTyr-binding forkhead associated (FHA) protein
MEIELTWEDTQTKNYQQQKFPLPLAIGREATRIPEKHQGQPLSKLVLPSTHVSGYHALIYLDNGNLKIKDFSTNGTKINSQLIHQAKKSNVADSALINNGDIIEVRPYKIKANLISSLPKQQVFSPQPQTIPSTNYELTVTKIPDSLVSDIYFNPETDVLQSHSVKTPIESFPPRQFLEARQVSVQDLHATGIPVKEDWDYVAVGGGLGSFTWVDHLRIFGVPADRIAVIGLGTKPYERYQYLCNNSQIPSHERLRSGSDSCPDNIWGWPGYAWREAWTDFVSLNWGSAVKHLWQVFAEPVFADTYTPKSGRVFASIDREADRIGWWKMLKYGRIRGIRQTNDGRYAIAYSIPNERARQHCYIVGRYVHLATGYPAVRFLQDLQGYRMATKDFDSVVNAYEPHNQIYEQLEREGGTVIVRGKGIVASRIIQRLYEARNRNPQKNISVIHLSRNPVAKGSKFDIARRKVANHWEFQPYNWPKATWGGDMRKMLESASSEKRRELLTAWDGTTTADRSDWRRIVQQGLDEGWYILYFGQIEQVEQDSRGKPLVFFKANTLTKLQSNQEMFKIEADFIIDCTGLESKPNANPLLNDLLTHYNLPLNSIGRIQVENDFEIRDLRNGKGKIYAAGIITLGGPYAPVDTFLGLQYAAQKSVDALVKAKAPELHYLNGAESLGQWCRWVLNQEP